MNATEQEEHGAPESCRKHSSGCGSCLWGGIECKRGSLYQENKNPEGSPCANWAYYD